MFLFRRVIEEKKRRRRNGKGNQRFRIQDLQCFVRAFRIDRESRIETLQNDLEALEKIKFASQSYNKV